MDAALSSAGEPGAVVLDYIVSESKPWIAYAQVSNTGTESTDEWRQRIGGVHYQVTGHDDILTVDYLTAKFDSANAFATSYEIPLVQPDYLTAKVYGSYSDFGAENLEIRGAPDSEGETITYGAELAYTPFYYKEHAFSAVAGLKYEDLTVENLLGGGEGAVTLLSPYFRLQASKNKQVHRSMISVGFEQNIDTSNDEGDVTRMGRLDTTDDYKLVTFDIHQSFFLEPLFAGYRQVNKDKWLANSLVHELAFSFRGQYALDDARLIPQKQYFGGGFFSVRGYEESVARGDSGYVGSAEYRIHLARLLRPSSLMEEVDPKAEANDIAVRDRFNYRAPSLYGMPDWDLMIRGFVDYASFTFSDARSDEIEQDLFSAGVGIELQLKSNLNIRLDYGVVLNELEDFAGRPIEDAESGDSRAHFIATYSF